MGEALEGEEVRGIGWRDSARRSSSETADSPLSIRKQPSASKASSTKPAMNGPKELAILMPRLSSSRASTMRARPTRSGINARRVGQSIAQAQPITRAMTARCHSLARSVASSNATIPYMTKVTAWAAIMSGRRPMRSASAPPNPPTKSTGIARQKPTSPTRPGELVNSSTSQPRTIISTKWASHQSVLELRSRR